MRIVLVGMSHRTAPLAVRERLSVADAGPVLVKLVAGDEVEEAVLLSTCNRVEVLALTRRPEAARHRLRSFFYQGLSGAPDLSGSGSVDAMLYEHLDANAVRHVFRVAASLDSMVLGEPQILGQVKDAFRSAMEAGTCGVILGRLFHHAFATAKRVRSETRIAQRPVSVARVAVDLAHQIFEELSDKRALLVGAGEMIEVALERLREQAGLAAVSVANRTAAHAAELAARFGAQAYGLEALPELVADADLILTSIAAERPLLDRELFEQALRARRRRPMFVIDIGVPRNVEPEVNRLDDVYLYDLDDLSGIAESNAEERRQDALRAEAIVQEAVQRFDGWLSALGSVPTIQHLRARAEAIRAREVERAVARLRLGELERETVEQLTRAIVNKILHAPVSRLHQEAGREEGLAYLEAARVLFALDDPTAPGAEVDGQVARSGARSEPEAGGVGRALVGRTDEE